MEIAVHTGGISVWTVFFMRKIMKWIGLALFIWSMFWGVELLRDKAQLQERIVRLHVVANSDSEEDQTMKLKVRDAIVAYLNTSLAEFQDIDQVKAYLAENLQTLENMQGKVPFLWYGLYLYK